VRACSARNALEVNSPASRVTLVLGNAGEDEAGGAVEKERRGRGTRSGSRDEGKELTRRGILSQIELHQAGI